MNTTTGPQPAATQPAAQRPAPFALGGSLARTRLTLEARNPQVRTALVDAHLMHRLVMDGFTQYLTDGETEGARARLGILYATRTGGNRVDLVIQAEQVPTFEETPGLIDLRTWTEPAPTEGRIAFQITVAPASSRSDGPGTRSRRRPITDPVQQHEWLIRALTRRGLGDITATLGGTMRLDSEIKSKPRDQRRGSDDKFHHTAITAAGHATITEPEAFTEALQIGVGPAKAYGCGLLLARPAAPRA